MLITNATLVTWEVENRVLEDGALLIEDDRIKEVGTSHELFNKYPNEEKLDADGQYVMPCLVDAIKHGTTTLIDLIPGAIADIIFVDYQPNTPLTAGNLPWHIIFGAQQSMVTTTIVAGKVLMKDRQLLTLDEKEISAKAREIAPKVWERYNNEVAKVL